MSEYRSIGEVLAVLEAEFPDITISKIRFLESQGLLQPARTPAGYRQFCDADVEQLRWVLTQQRDHFLPLRVMRERIKSGDWGSTPRPPTAPAPTGATPAQAGPTAAPAGPTSAVSSAADTTAPETSSAHNAGAIADASGHDLSGASLRSRPLAADDPLDVEPAEAPPALREIDLSARKGKHGLEAVARQANLDTIQVRELAHYGIIEAVGNDPTPMFDDDAIVIAKAASAFMAHGVEPRHLKAWRTAADREASLFEQLTVPLLRQGSEGARIQALSTAAELVELGGQLRYALLRRALRTSLGRVASA